MSAQLDIPDLYVDQFRVTTGAYGAAMTFGLTPAHPSPAQAVPSRDLVTLRMSLEHAKVMILLLRKILKDYERGTGVTVEIPQQLCAQLGVSLEDW